MRADEWPQFGTPDAGATYAELPGAYAVILDSGRLLVVETPSGLYLPGGGLDPGESAAQALHREVSEETGYRVAALARLGRAAQYVGSGTNKIEDYFAALVAGMMSSGPDCDDRPRWVGVEEALAGLAEAAQAWAVRTAERPGRRWDRPAP